MLYFEFQNPLILCFNTYCKVFLNSLTLLSNNVLHKKHLKLINSRLEYYAAGHIGPHGPPGPISQGIIADSAPDTDRAVPYVYVYKACD